MSIDLSARPRIREDVVFGPGLRAGDTAVYHVKDHATGWYYKLGPREHFVLSRMDGEHSLDDINAEYVAAFGKRLGPQSWEQIFGLLHRRRLLGESADADLAELERLRAAAAAETKRSRSTLLLKRIPLVNPDRLLGLLAPRAGLLFSPRFVVPVLIATCGVWALVISEWSEIWGQMRLHRGAPLYLALVITTSWVIHGVHEFAHGLTCKRYGGSVPEIGVMWRFPLLAPYCRTDDVMLFAAPRHRVYTAFAGVFASLTLSVLFAGLWLVTADGSTMKAFAGSMVLFTSLASLVNFIPFLRLDGYYMLTHALGLADLRVETYKFWGHLLRRHMAEVQGYRRRDLWTYVAYGVGSALFAAALIGTIFTLWFTRLSGWLGPVPAAAILTAEAALIITLIVYARRRKRS
ncbi:hypothetical protein GCM10009555_046250 [Acrocarpospora macrocephala]|uniref:Peptidase M50 n=1 Tax=Acrocarpospora macrocephala TaxID=150177 RepID=A0A5M3X0Z4_9ACTN|nr:M50 family metallopeptidase [Acrocarpospora macrocephala]GES11968.1 hypothetical protein Amac_055650 [Acrocarpospora macrocephala]